LPYGVRIESKAIEPTASSDIGVLSTSREWIGRQCLFQILADQQG
jgi:hypothetical protein